MQTLLNQFVYFAFFQSVFLLGIYVFSKKNRKNINGYVAFLIFVLLLGLSGRVLYISEVFGKTHRLIALSEFATLFFGSTVFLFTRSSLENKRFSYKDLTHYVPGVLYVVFIVLYYMVPSKEIIAEKVKSGELFKVVAVVIGIGLLFNIGYWGASLHRFLRYREKLKNELSYTVKTQFFLNFLISIGMCLASWAIVYLISIIGPQKIERQARQFIWLGIAFIILFISYYKIIAPGLFTLESLQLPKKYAQSKLTISDLNRLKTQLETLMYEKKPYLNNKLLKAELAEMLGVSNPELARLLNERIGMNFFEYINYHRIKEFVSLAESNEYRNLTFYGLAQEAGFNSKTTFNKSFKKLMGKSPSEYFNKEIQ